MVALIGQKMLHRPEQVAAKSALRAVGGVEALTFEQLGEERLGEVAGLVGAGGTRSLDEQRDWFVVGLAQFAQRLASLGGATAYSDTTIRRVASTRCGRCGGAA